MKPKTFIKQLRLVLRIIAVGIWCNIAFNYAMKCEKETKNPPTKEVRSIFSSWDDLWGLRTDSRTFAR